MDGLAKHCRPVTLGPRRGPEADNDGRRPSEPPEAEHWTWRLVIASCVACLGLFSIGLYIGFVPTSIADLKRDHRSALHVTSQQQSWYVSLPFLGALVGSFFSGSTMDWLGRKTSLLFSAVPIVVGYVVVCALRDVEMLYVSAFVIGFGLVTYESAARVYVAEIATVDSRSVLMSCQEVFLGAGYLVAIVADDFMRWNWLAILCAVPPVVVAILMIPCPESPRWLAMRGKTEAATFALQWLRGSDVAAAKELEEIRAALASHGTLELPSWRSLLQPPHVRALLVTQVLFLLREFSGYTAIRLYVVSVFESVDTTTLSSHAQSAITGAIILLGHILCMVIVDCFRRTVLLTVCLVGMAAGLAIFGATFFLHNVLDATTRESLFWLPIASMAMALLFHTLGIGPLPHIISNEMVSTQARSRVHSLGVTVNYLTAFVVTKTFVDLLDGIGPAATFWLYGAICLLGAAFVGFFVPETKGKSLEELERQFGQQRRVETEV